MSRARVVVLAGPSGAGKSRLAARLQAAHGWPIMRLDDFYRDEDDPAMPRSTGLGIVDWDHPDSWDREAAVAALATLVDTGTVQTPVYDLAQSRVVGSATLLAGPQDLVLAEGIFAAEIIDDLRREGLLAAAYCVHHHRVVYVPAAAAARPVRTAQAAMDAGPPRPRPDARRAGGRGQAGAPRRDPGTGPRPGTAAVGTGTLTAAAGPAKKPARPDPVRLGFHHASRGRSGRG